METAHRVLVLDDEADVREWIADVLREGGLEVTPVADGAAMQEAMLRQPHSLVIMDLRLKGEDGLTLARSLRQRSTVPIMMMSGKGDETDRVLGLELAADDYLTKPFSGRELLARVRASLRRCTELSQPAARRESAHERYAFGDWMLDVTQRQLSRADGSACRLTQGEFALLAAMVRHPHRIWTRDQLLDQTRGFDTEVYDRSVDVLILRMRRKIELNPSQPAYIRTERGQGYVFCGTVTRV
ncbi:response regulator transcription factor [Niveibacterium sp. SC-1]|uniref:response regulator transcription factor n=1 Tax=Niveibacterium sp. SC-1 TaxID=3135646 RepID=UPI00311D6FE2